MAIEMQVEHFENSLATGFGKGNLVSDLHKTAAFVTSLVMTEESSHDAISSLWKKMRNYRKKIEQEKESAIEPYQEILDYVKAVSDKAKEITKGVMEVEKCLKEKSVEYHEMLERRQEEERKSLQEASNTIGCFEPVYVPQKPEAITNTGATSYFVTKKKYRVVDETQIPREFLMVDEEKVNLAISRGMEIPGIESYEEKEIRLRSR